MGVTSSVRPSIRPSVGIYQSELATSSSLIQALFVLSVVENAVNLYPLNHRFHHAFLGSGNLRLLWKLSPHRIIMIFAALVHFVCRVCDVL